MWGEWNGHVHHALGCVGTVTQGAVRDLDALERLGFHTFATSVSVAHGYGAFVGYGEPVTVAGSIRSFVAVNIERAPPRRLTTAPAGYAVGRR